MKGCEPHGFQDGASEDNVYQRISLNKDCIEMVSLAAKEQEEIRNLKPYRS